MKLLSFFILVSAITTLAANSYSQQTKFNISFRSATVREVLQKIEDSSEFIFLYSEKSVDVDRKVDVNVTNQTVDVVLDQLFNGTRNFYEIRNRQISILEKGSTENSYLKIGTESSQQQKSISGKVTDSAGGSLPGVSVVVKGTTTGVITDVDGKYTLAKVPESAILQFSFVGMKTQEMVVGNKTVINLVLVEESIGIEEVVAVGYGTMKKSDLTGSLSQVKSQEINAYPSTNVLQALTGKSAGVQVLQTNGSPGGAMSIRIRGANSIQGSNEPLYVVDGFPVENTTALNNSDIESIEILKDASSTAIYGSRGANGVVLITTKKGKAGKNTIDFESSYSIQSLIKKQDFMTAKEYATIYNTLATNDKVASYFTDNEINSFGKGFDWQDYLFQKAPMLTTSLNINGGNEKTKFSISGSILNQDGLIKGSDYDRYSIRSNIDHKFSEKFSVNLSTTFTRINNGTQNSEGGSRGNSLISLEATPPTLTPYNDDGSIRDLSTVYSFISIVNPANYLDKQSTSVRANKALINAALIFNPIKDLTIKVAGGIENRDVRTDSYTSREFIYSSGSASVSTSQYTSLLNENTITYNKTINKHSISALAGFTYQDFLNTSLAASGSGFLSDNFETYNLSAAANSGVPSSGYSKSILTSYLGRINYNYISKYFATISFRGDGTSKFSKGNKWGYFPSAALAWRVSEETFLKNNSKISNLKLRASWGLTGSQAIDAYVTLNRLSSGKVIFNDALYNTFAPGTQLPGDLKWESTEQFDIGLDLGINSNRFTITADYYNKNTKDLLNTVTLPASLGYTSTIQNVGEIQNKGVELGLEAQIFTGKFKWDMNANISFNRNNRVTRGNFTLTFSRNRA